jgi:hypothetical protein
MCSKQNFDKIVTKKDEYQTLFELSADYLASAKFKEDI